MKLNSHHQIYQFTLILYVVGIRCDVDSFKLTARAQSNYREVNGSFYNTAMDCTPCTTVNGAVALLRMNPLSNMEGVIIQ